MKVILSYGSYFNHGKKYQVKFIYENQQEIENTASLMNQLKDTDCFNFYYLDDSGNISIQDTNIYGGTDIPKDTIHHFISMLLLIKNTTVVAGTQEMTEYEPNTLENAINQLHINGTINKGPYFNNNSTYYIEFKYASDQQKDEILYEFHTRLSQLAGPNEKREKEGKEHLMPYLTDRTGNFISQNANIISAINLPIDLINTFVKIFLEEHNMVINVGSYQFKENFDEAQFNEAIMYLKSRKARKRKKRIH